MPQKSMLVFCLVWVQIILILKSSQSSSLAACLPVGSLVITAYGQSPSFKKFQLFTHQSFLLCTVSDPLEFLSLFLSSVLSEGLLMRFQVKQGE